MSAPDQSGLARVSAVEHSSSNRGHVQLLDGGVLLAFIGAHMTEGSAVRQAIYRGLDTRVRRGDFDHHHEEER